MSNNDKADAAAIHMLRNHVALADVATEAVEAENRFRAAVETDPKDAAMVQMLEQVQCTFQQMSASLQDMSQTLRHFQQEQAKENERIWQALETLGATQQHQSVRIEATAAAQSENSSDEGSIALMDAKIEQMAERLEELTDVVEVLSAEHEEGHEDVSPDRYNGGEIRYEIDDGRKIVPLPDTEGIREEGEKLAQLLLSVKGNEEEFKKHYIGALQSRYNEIRRKEGDYENPGYHFAHAIWNYGYSLFQAENKKQVPDIAEMRYEGSRLFNILRDMGKVPEKFDRTFQRALIVQYAQEGKGDGYGSEAAWIIWQHGLAMYEAYQQKQEEQARLQAERAAQRRY